MCIRDSPWADAVGHAHHHLVQGLGPLADVSFADGQAQQVGEPLLAHAGLPHDLGKLI